MIIFDIVPTAVHYFGSPLKRTPIFIGGNYDYN